MPKLTIVRSSDIIEAKSRNGVKYWQNHVVKDHEGKFYTQSSSWATNAKTGKTSVVKWSDPYYAVPTNEGRANYRNNEDQAHFEFESTVNKQKDKRESERPLPMLAEKYVDKKERLTFPCYVQRKYNGMRMLYDGKQGWSRGNKDIIPKVIQHLAFDNINEIVTLDGELMLPGNVKLQETMSAAKKYREDVSPKLIYVVYDILHDTLPFHERYEVLKKIVREIDNPQIVLAETITVHNHEDITSAQKRFTADGFEGTIIRMRNGLYEVNLRSSNLLKLKDFVDEEFKIVDVINSGGGSADGVGKFVCLASNGKEFEAVSEGDIGYRKNLLTNKHKYIGKWATVRYFELTNDGKPQHGVAVDVREDGDF